MFGRIFMAMILALALALGPLAMPGAAVIAAVPAAHHDMAGQSHCDERQPDRQEHRDKADKNCCVAGCAAVAALPVQALEPAALSASRERPAPDRFRRGYLGEIATPPPRLA